MLAFNQAHSSWRRLIIILATATTMAVMGVSSASSAPKFVAPEPIVSGPHSKTAVRFFTINQILAESRWATSGPAISAIGVNQFSRNEP